MQRSPKHAGKLVSAQSSPQPKNRFLTTSARLLWPSIMRQPLRWPMPAAAKSASYRKRPAFRCSDPGRAQAESIADDRDRGERHGKRGKRRAQENAEHGIEQAGRNRSTEGVVDKGKEQVLVNVAHGGAAKRARPRNAG